MERDSNQHNYDLETFTFWKYISPYEKGIFKQPQQMALTDFAQ
jgi:hypothetical protein